MLINVLLTVLGIFLLTAFEGFLTTLFSFSVIITFLLFLLDRVRWEVWLILAFVITIFVDILLQRVLGTTLFVVSISSAVLYLLFLIVPKKDVLLSYVPYLVSILIFYTLINLLTPFLQDGVWGIITWQGLLYDLIRSFVAVGIIFVINTIIDNFRAHDSLTL